MVSTHHNDEYSPYETGLCQLLAQIRPDHARYIDALTYQHRLTENIKWCRRYGDTEMRKTERAEIITRLNELALSTLGVPFSQLYDVIPPPPPPPPPTLTQEIERRGPFTSDEAIRLTIELCRELTRSHGAGKSHTPLQAESMLYIGGDTPTIQLAETAIAPAAADQDAERSADALGTGRLLYEMLTKTAPGDSPAPPSSINPAVDPALNRIVLQSLTPGAFPAPQVLHQRLERYQDGNVLRDMFERGEHFSTEESIWQAVRLCNQLEQHHTQKRSHHHLTSDNVVLVDIGDKRHARWVESAVLSADKGGEDEDAEDVRAVGAVLYEMLTKIQPGDSPLSPSSSNPAVPPSLDRIVLQSLAFNPRSTPEALQWRLETYLAGNVVSDRLRSEKRFLVEECIWQAIRLCNQLEQHHAQGLFHQDLVSDNVVLVDAGDKRHARWVESAVLSTDKGTEDEDAEDVRAVGAILYEMLTGHPPPPDSTECALFSGASLWVHLGLDRIVLKAIAPEPTERYRDVVILRERLYYHLPRLRQAEEIDTLIQASYPIVYIVSWEEERVLALLRQVAGIENKPFYSWTLSQGLRDASGHLRRGTTRPEGPLDALDRIITSKEEALYVLFDFHPFLRQSHLVPHDAILRRMRDLAAETRHTPKAVAIVAPTLEIPPECEKDITVMHFGLSTPGEIADVLDDTIALVRKSGGRVDLSRDTYEDLVRSATGLTLAEAERAFALACMRKAVEQNQRVLDRDAIEVVLKEKERALYKSSALEIFSNPEGFNDIGGLEVLKEWARKRARAFTIEAQDFGLPAPKGVLLIGVPGCGKSLAAKAIASAWKKPLLRLDAGALFSSRVGSSEENLRNALQVAEAVAPSILWIDEIEKSFAGTHTIDDGGVTARVLGGLITWLQEKTTPVFVVATANSLGDLGRSGRGQGYTRSGGLPPELLRKGRFDELFFVDLPDREERKRIFEIHLRKRGHDSAAFNLDELANESEGYSGAEIEQAVLSAMYDAFNGLDRLYELVRPSLERLDEESPSLLEDLSPAELEEGWRALLTEAFSVGASVGEKPRAALVLKGLFERFQAEWSAERLLKTVMTTEWPGAEPTMGLNQSVVLRSLRQIVPLSIVMGPQIEALRQWAKDNARSASRSSEYVPGRSSKQHGVHVDLHKKGD